ncbi:MAG: amino acid permease [Chlamydiae bacterium]|nr:amino acid permease [Chlamydiota bacterium]
MGKKESLAGKINLFELVMLSSVLVVSLRNLPMIASTGVTMFFFAIASLASSIPFLIAIQLLVIWVFTFLNMRGLHTSSFISSVGFLGGVLFPGLFIMGLAGIYLWQHLPIQLNFSTNFSGFLPDFNHVSTIVLLLAFTRAFAGIEVSAAHANKVEKPQVNYPIAILFVVIVGVFINLFGALSVSIVVPQKDLSLIAGVMEAVEVFFKQFDIVWLVPIFGLLLAAGQTAGASAWFIGPVKGLLETARKGELPPFFKKVNKNDVPAHLLILQGVVISVISTGFLFLPSINLAFWFSVVISMMVYFTMYFMLMLAALYLRYKKPDVPRAFKVPFKNVGMWIVSGVGMITMLFSFILAIFPTKPEYNVFNYMALSIGSFLVIFIIPFIIHKFKNPKWSKMPEEK